MRVLMIHPHDIYHDLEPWTVRITYLADELAQAGYEVKLIYHMRDPWRNAEDEMKHQGFSFETIPFSRFIPSMKDRIRFMSKWAYWADVIHFQKCSHYAAIPAVCSALYHRKPIHYDWDDWEQKIYELDSNHSRIGAWIFFHQMERHLLKLVDTVSVASLGLKSLTQRYNFPQDRVFHIPVGSDLKTFSPHRDGSEVKNRYGLTGPIVLYQGQISGANYVHLFLSAAQIVLCNRKDVHFLVVGGGDRLDQAQNLARKLNITDHVLFTGAVPHRQVAEHIAAADIAVACFENNEQARCKSPLKLAEYMASGKAIIANEVGDVPFMLGNCGKLIRDDTPVAIAEAVILLLNDRNLTEDYSRKARKRAEELINWHTSAQTLISAYHKAFHVRYDLSA